MLLRGTTPSLSVTYLLFVVETPVRERCPPVPPFTVVPRLASADLEKYVV